MAQCILCKAKIPDGTQYCENCYSKVRSKADESYLDSLLSSVTSPDDNSKGLNRQALRDRQEHKEEKRKNMNDDILDGVPSDYNIFSKSDDDSDLDFLNGLFNQAIANTTSEDCVETTLETDADTLPEIAVTKEPIIEEPMTPELAIEEPVVEEPTIGEPTIEELTNEEFAEKGNTKEQSANKEPITETKDEIPSIEQSIVSQTSEQLDLDISKQNQSDKEESKFFDNNSIDDLSDSDQDILDLINEINNSEELPPIEDVTNYGEQLGNDYHTEQELERTNTSNIGDVFSDALSAITSLQDKDDSLIVDDDLLSMIPDVNNTDIPTSEDNNSNQATKKSKKKKNGIFSRLFGNIKEERSEEELEQLKQKAIEDGEKKEAEKKAKEQEEKAKKELTKAQKAENALKAKEEAKKKKLEKDKKAKEKKAEKERRSREIQELIDEIDENEGKINKVGAGIIFVWFAAIAVVIVVGTNIYSYSLAIENAKNNFEIQHYNEAYKNVYGIDIKDEDIEFYDQLMTVMFVNKQLNSYKHYYDMKMYPEALDSLLKGLERYDKYYSLGQLLGIESDLDYIRNEILDKLDTTFDITEDEANVLLSYEDQAEYSGAIYELLSNRIKVSADDKEDISKDEK